VASSLTRIGLPACPGPPSQAPPDGGAVGVGCSRYGEEGLDMFNGLVLVGQFFCSTREDLVQHARVIERRSPTGHAASGRNLP
jgi:hypothetical protein